MEAQFVRHGEETLFAYARYRCGGDDIVRRAVARARKSHALQKRDGGEPYIVHPLRVATHFMQFMQGDILQEDVATAVLHDVLEDDPEVTAKMLQAEFGVEVASAVEMLSKDTPERRLTAEEYRQQVLAAPLKVRVIKLCDRLDNLLSLHSCPDSGKVRRYRERTADYYGAIGTATDTRLLQIILDELRSGA
jgi:GTP pyrophosphokinase